MSITVRHCCAVSGVAIAVGAIAFIQLFVSTNAHQGDARAAKLLAEVPVAAEAKTVRMQLDYRPGGHVLQGPPMIAALATDPGVRDATVTRALFAQRGFEPLKVGDELVLVGTKGVHRLRIGRVLDWNIPVRGYPNVFVSPETAAAIKEDWQPAPKYTVESLSPLFQSDEGRNIARADMLLLWAAALTALCLLVNTLSLSVEAKRRDLAILRMLGLTAGGVVRRLLAEALALSAAGLAIGIAAALAAIRLLVRFKADLFPMGVVVPGRMLVTVAALALAVSVLAVLCAMRSALSVRPLEAASARPPRVRRAGMLVSFACGFGAFVAVEVWGTSLTKPFIPSPEWPDAIVSMLPAGVSAFDIGKLQHLEGVKELHELEPLQINFHPLEEVSGFAAKGQKHVYRNLLLLASDRLPEFKFVSGTREAALAELAKGDAAVITEMMARARGLHLGDFMELDLGAAGVGKIKVAGIVDCNWHMVTSRAWLRGLARGSSKTTDGPAFVTFDTLEAFDPRPADFVRMTHVWLDYEPEFVAKCGGVFAAGNRVEKEIAAALGEAAADDTIRVHARDEVADGTLAHSGDIVGTMALIPYVFLAVISLGFVAFLVAAADARKREFAVLRAVGATKLQLAGRLVREAVAVASVSLVFAIPIGALAGWLFASVTRNAMATWGLPACFSLPLDTVLGGAAGAILIALAVAVPTALTLVYRNIHR